jgi:hypothetical protein
MPLVSLIHWDLQRKHGLYQNSVCVVVLIKLYMASAVIDMESLFSWGVSYIHNPLRPAVKTWTLPEFCGWCLKFHFGLLSHNLYFSKSSPLWWVAVIVQREYMSKIHLQLSMCVFVLFKNCWCINFLHGLLLFILRVMVDYGILVTMRPFV